MDASDQRFQTRAEFQDAHEALMDRLDSALRERSREATEPADAGQDDHEVLVRMMGDIDGFLRQGARSGAYIHESRERRNCQALLDYWATRCYGAGFDIRRPLLAGPDASVLPQLPDSACPYVGLAAFGEKDARHFFGRTDQVAELLARLKDERLIIVTGASGSGKSSLVLAGLVPALKAGAIADSAQWRYLPVIVPGTAPLENLARAVLAAGGGPQARLAEEASGFLRDAGHLVKLLADDERPALLVVDQFEEVVTLQTAETSKACLQFVENLLRLVDAAAPPHRLILTMRNDVGARFARDYENLYHRYGAAAFPVYSMESAYLRDAIERPASLVGLKFQDGVVDELVKSVVGEDSSLPLLQFSLMALWDKRNGNLITREAYGEVGSPKQAMAHAAKRVYDDLSAEQQIAARSVFLTLSQLGEGGSVFRARASRRELRRLADPGNVDLVLDKFEAARLIRVSRAAGTSADDDLAEVAHESLLRNWELLNTLFIAERDKRERSAFLLKQAEKWRQGSFDNAFLLSGLALRQAQEEIDAKSIKRLERDFLAASEKVEAERNARLKRDARRLFYALVAATVLAIIAFAQWRQAAQGQRTAEARRLASNAAVQVNTNSELGVLLAMEALHTDPAVMHEIAPVIIEATRYRRPLWRLSAEQVEPALPGSLGRINSAFRRLFGEGSVVALSLSPDGKRLLVANENSVVEWNVETPKPEVVRRLPLPGGSAAVRFLAYGPGRTYVAAATNQGPAVWDASGAPMLRDFGPAEPLRRIEFNHDGSMLAGLTDDGEGLRVWSLPQGQPLLSVKQVEGAHQYSSIYFDRQSEAVVLIRPPQMGEMRLKLYRYKLTGTVKDAKPETVETGDCVPDLAFAAAGGRAGISIYPSICSYDARSATKSAAEGLATSTERQAQTVDDIVFGGGGRLVAKLSRSNSEVHISDIESGQTARLQGAFDLEKRSSYEESLSISADGTRFAIQGSDGSIRGFDLGMQSRPFRDYGRPLWISPDDGTILAPSFKDGRAGLGRWEIATGSLRYQVDVDRSAASGVWPTSDGRHLIVNRQCPPSTGAGYCVSALPVDGSRSVDIRVPEGSGGSMSWAGRTGDLILIRDGNLLKVYKAGGEAPVFSTEAPPPASRGFAARLEPVTLGMRGFFAVKRLRTDGVSIEVYKVEDRTAQPIKSLFIPIAQVTKVSFTGDSRFLMVQSGEQVRLWSLAKAGAEPVLDLEGVLPNDIRVPAGSALAITRNKEGPWEIRDLDKGGRVLTSLPRAFLIEPSGRYAWGTPPGAAHLEIRSLLDDRAEPLKVDASALPTSFAGAAALVEFPREGRARIYSMKTGKILVDTTRESIASPSSLSPDGQFFIDKYQRLIPADLGRLLEDARKWAGRPLTDEERCTFVDPGQCRE
ncbi:NACHT and WD repeat domain-containing protein [Variovorax sp. JS1663]|uniref:NACHT and WD repeat domain-containing protein n=1 Tax=Variovorax sp. JS1663 TaxID=1851577 RepID=UPI000B344B9F|nr:NACHT and WD repeat domain-containing protein [Variovorax sp. JS1663]OUM01981.1 hypothetical protein A8M77_12760 [Variovorax sp. JS1663]